MRTTQRRRPRRGRGFMDILKKGNDFLKKTQLISNVAGALNNAGIASKYTGAVANIAGNAGYGRRRRGNGRRRPVRGKGFMDILKKGNDFLKKTQLISNVAGALNNAGIASKYTGAVANMASNAGYGRRRRGRARARTGRGRTRRAMHGKGFKEFLGKANDWLKKTKIISSVGNVLGGIIPGAGLVSNIAGAAGYGRPRGRRMRGRGIGHLGTAFSPVGIAGATAYSSGRVQF